MNESIEQNYVLIPAAQEDAVRRIVSDRALGDDDKKAALVDAFARHDIPINGYFSVGGRKVSFIDFATDRRCEPLLEMIVERAPNKATEGLDVLAESVWSAKAVSILLNNGVQIDSEPDRRGPLVLRTCAEMGAPGAIALLAAKGLDLDQMVTLSGIVRPALVHAARRGRASVVEGFLRAGANPTAVGSDGRTFLHASVLLDGTQSAAITDNLESLEILRKVLDVTRELGIDLDPQDTFKRSPLHRAAEQGYKNKVALMLEYGANPDLRDNNQMTPLDLAEDGRHTEVTSVFLAWKAQQAIAEVLKAARKPSTC